MGNLKITPNLFLHSAELNRLINFLDAEGFRKALISQSKSFGLVKTDPLLNFRLESGTAQGTLRLRTDSLAVDAAGNFITQAPFDNLPVPVTGSWQWAKISYQSSPNEVGSVAVDLAGNLSGTDTRFTEVLRGQPNFPSVIAFPDSQGNTQRYEVVQVLSDTQAVLAGGAIFQPESGLAYKVIGTFTPDFVPPLEVQDIFQYDGCKLELVPEAVLNVAPNKLAGTEFYLARVKNDGTTINIQDKRTEFWTERGVGELQRMDRSPNPLIGIEAIKWADDYSTRTENLCFIGWGLRSDNWTTDPILNRLTLIGGSGGKFKSTAAFTNGDFDGWRVYAKDGTYTRVLSSQKTGSQINLTLGVLNPDQYATGDVLTVVPDCETVEISFQADPDLAESQLLDRVFTFPVQAGVGRCDVLVPADSYYYSVLHRTRQINTYTPWDVLPADAVGYYTESSFDSEGILYTDPAKVRRQHTGGQFVNGVVSGYVLFNVSPNSFRKFSDKIDLGDALGVAFRQFDNGNPLTELRAGVDKQHQIFQSPGSLGLTVDHAIALSSVGAREGNVFYLTFEASLVPGDKKVGIYSNYVNAGNTGRTLKILTRTELDYMRIPGRKVAVKAVYTGTYWHLTTLETDPSHLGKIDAFFDISRADFDDDGKGIGEEVLGYRLCTELAGKFTVGLDPAFFLDTTSTVVSGDYSEVGKQGGEKQHTLTIDEMPAHNHAYTDRYTEDRQAIDAGSNTRRDQDRTENKTTGFAGGSQPHENRPPYYTVAYLQRVPYTA